MMAAMALLCLTANAQKARHLPGDITVQPMIGEVFAFCTDGQTRAGVVATERKVVVFA